jgi:hypothetical protein
MGTPAIEIRSLLSVTTAYGKARSVEAYKCGNFYTVEPGTASLCR